MQGHDSQLPSYVTERERDVRRRNSAGLPSGRGPRADRARWGCDTVVLLRETPDELPNVESSLRPGSLVSFYFDDRIRQAEYDDRLRITLEDIIRKTRGAVIGALLPDGFRIDARVAVSSVDLAEEIADLGASVLFFGEFPGRDNDGVAAITLQVPDADGRVRPHPY